MESFARGSKSPAEFPFSELTAHEGDVFELLAQRLTNAAIGRS